MRILLICFLSFASILGNIPKVQAQLFLNNCIDLYAQPTDSGVVLSWNQLPYSTQYFSAYSIYMGNSSEVFSNNFTKIQSLTSLTQTSYTVSGLANNTTYYFYILIEDTASGYICRSNETNAYPSASIVPPPSWFTTTNAVDSIDVKWTRVSNAGIAYYKIYGDTLIHPTKVLDSTFSFTDTSRYIQVNQSKIYYFRVTSVDTNGIESSYSTELINRSFSYSAPPAGPTGLHYSLGNQQLILKWNPSTQYAGFRYYVIYRGLQPQTLIPFGYTSVNNVNDSTYTITSLAYNVNYYYAIKVYDIAGYASDTSNLIAVYPVDTFPPGIPQNLSAYPGDGQALLRWEKAYNPDNDFSRYNIYSDTLPNPTNLIDFVYGISDTTYIAQSLQNNKTYYFRVSSQDASNNVSGFSNQVSVVPNDTTPPLSPSSFSATIDSTKTTLSWNPTPNISGDFLMYVIERGTNAANLTPIDSIYSLQTASYIDTGLTNGVRYFYSISAVDSLFNYSADKPLLSVVPFTVEREMNNEFYQANLLENLIIGEISNSLDKDFFKIIVTQPTQLTIETEAIPFLDSAVGTNIGNTNLFLFAPNGSTQLAFNNNNPANPNYSRIFYVANTPGTYYVMVKGDMHNDLGHYRLKLTRLEPDAYEPNNNIFEAPLLADTQFIPNLSIFPLGDVDVFAFKADNNYLATVSYYTPFYVGTIKFLNGLNQVLKTVNANQASFIVPDTSEYFVSYEVSSFVVPNYGMDFKLIPPPNYSDSFAITEIHYTQQNHQFIEIYNRHNKAIDISGYSLGGVNFTFPPSSLFPAHTYWVIAKDSSAFYNRYGFYPNFKWTSGSLSFSGTNLELFDTNQALVDFVYYTNGGTFPSVSSNDRSIELLNVSMNNSVGTSWYTSHFNGGTPGHSNSTPLIYYPDSFEINNTKQQAYFFLNEDTIQGTLSELSDTTDWFLFRAQAFDTITYLLNLQHTQLKALVEIYTKSDSLIAASTFSANQIVQIVPDFTDSIYVKVKIIEDSLQFIINEGAYTLLMMVKHQPHQAPWIESFENVLPGLIPPAWRRINADNNNNTWEVAGINIGFQNTKGLSIANNPAGNNDWIITPPVYIKNDDAFTFMARSTATFFKEKLQVWIGSENAKYVSDFTQMLDTFTVDSVGYKKYDISLNNFIGQTVKFAIRNVSIGQNICYVDNVGVEPPFYDTSLRGNVIDLATQQALPGVQVGYAGNFTLTDSLGNYILDEVKFGLNEISYTKAFYTTAKYNINFNATDTIIRNVAMFPDSQATIYTNIFDSAGQRGFTLINNPALTWQRKDQIALANDTIIPFAGDSMLVAGGASGLPANALAYWRILDSPFGFNFSNYSDVEFSFKRNSNSGNSGKLYIWINQNTFYDINNDSLNNTLDFLGGNTNGWVSHSFSLKNFLTFQNMELGFLYLTDSLPFAGWGVAIDSIKVKAYIQQPKPMPVGLTAQSYVMDSVPLHWNSPSPNVASYNIFKMEVNNNPFNTFSLLTNVTDTFFVDTAVVNFKTYSYKVSAVYPYGESALSQPATAIVGVPSLATIPYSQNFNNTGTALPTNWAFDLSPTNYWAIGNGPQAFAFNNNFYGLSPFAYANFFTIGLLNQYFKTALTSPWFNCNPLNNRLLLSFNALGFTQGEFHCIAYKDALGVDWTIIDTLPNLSQWASFRYDVTDYAQGKNYFQIGFLIIKDSTQLPINNIGLAIDDFSLQEVQSGYIHGVVSSQTGMPMPNIRLELTDQDTAKWYNKPISKYLYTDTLGAYSSDTLDVYNGFPYGLKVSAWKHKAIEFNNLALQSNPSLTQNIQLAIDLPTPTNLTSKIDSLGFPILQWKQPKLFGEISYDDGQLFVFDTLAQGYSFAALFSTDAPKPYKLAQLGVYIFGDTTNASFGVAALSILPNGQPNLNDTLLNIFPFNVNATQAQWKLLNINAAIDTSHFYLVLYCPQNASGLPYRIGYSKLLGGTNSLKKLPTTNFFTKSEALMARAYVQVGETNFGYNSVNFTGTYSVFKKTPQNQTPQLLIGNISQTEHKDQNLSIGDSATYFVRANYSQYGISDNSNEYKFLMQGVPYLNWSNAVSKKVIGYTVQSDSTQFNLINSGLDTLQYAVQYRFGYTALHSVDTPSVMPIGILGSNIYTSHNPAPGDTAQLIFYIENVNGSNARLDEVEIDFPQGVNLLSGNNMTVYNSNRFLLFNGNSGNGAKAIFTDPNSNNQGEIYPYEVAVCTLNVAVSQSFTGPIIIDYSIKADNGLTKQDTLRLGIPKINLSLNPSNGNIPQSQSLPISATIQVNSHPAKGVKVPGYWRITSNDPQKPITTIPFDVYLDPARGVVEGIVTDNVSNALLSNAIVKMGLYTDTTGLDGKYKFENVPVGLYQIFASRQYFVDGQVAVNIQNHNDTVNRLIGLNPDVLRPINLTTSKETGAIRLNWEISKHILFYDMELPLGAGQNDIKDWKVYDVDNDGKTWAYFGAGPYNGNYSVSVLNNTSSQTNDWLVSRAIRIEKADAKLSFFASPQDLNFSEEEFLIRISTQGDNPTQFNDTLLYHKFLPGAANWTKFDVNLNANIGDTVWVAFQCVSTNQYMLKLDDISIVSARYIGAPVDSGVYAYNIYRSQNSSLFQKLDSIIVAADTATYLDSQILIDTLYSYYVTTYLPGLGIQTQASNIVTNKILSKDVGIHALVKPIDSRNHTASTEVEISIRNFGTDTLFSNDTILLAYTVNQSVPRIDTFIPTPYLAPGMLVNFTFSDSANLAAKGIYHFKIWSAMNDDNDASNDTLYKSIEHKPDTTTPPTWSVNPFLYQYNMSLTAQVTILDTLSTDTNDIIAAFVGNEVRGVGNIQYVQAFNKYVVQMNIYSNLTIENITFKVWDASRDSILPIIESYTFINNQIYGTLLNPEQLHTPSSNNYFDLSMEQILSPQAGALQYSNAETLSVSLKNIGTLPFVAGDSIAFGYSLLRNSQPHASATAYRILSSGMIANDTLLFTFPTTLNLEQNGTYQLRVWHSFISDFRKHNDTLTVILEQNPKNPPTWSVNPSSYQHSAFITARLFFDDILSTDVNDKVAAFINNQVRGVANIEYVSTFGQYVIQMPIYSNVSSGETIHFRAWKAATDRVFDIEESFVFSANSSYGNLLNPIRLHATTGYTISISNMENALQQIKLFPNPSKGILNLQNPLHKNYEIEVLNTLGMRVYSEQNIASPFKEIDLSHLPAQHYILRISAKDEFVTIPFVIVK